MMQQNLLTYTKFFPLSRHIGQQVSARVICQTLVSLPRPTICGLVVGSSPRFLRTTSFACSFDWWPLHYYVGVSVIGKTENVTCQPKPAFC